MTAAAVQLAEGLEGQQIPFDEIPQIDIAPLLDGSDPAGVAAEIGRACREVGFFYIKNHGVPQAQIDATFATAREFFDRPEAEKTALDIGQSGSALRGYIPLYGENTDPTRTADFKECFDVGTELAEGERPTPAFAGANQWPADWPEFRDTVYGYHQSMVALARKLMGAIALSLDLPENWIEDKWQRPITVQRLLHYPPQTGAVEEAELGIGAHSDYGSLTILAQDDVGGLQAQNCAGEWIAAPPIPGTFIINIGDLVQRWSNGLYDATVHRVINVSGRERYSIPFFIDADFDAEVAPVASCVSAENPPRFEPVTCGAHKLRRYGESFAHLQPAG